MKKTKKRSALVIALVVILLALSLGYAALSATLTINGTATGTGTWDVRFLSTRFVKADGSTVDNTHNGSATISTSQGGSTNDTITATVELAYPGDGVLLEAVVKNNGSIPAKLTSFSITGTDTDFEVTQAAGGPAANELLPAGGTCTAQFLVKWKANSTATSLGTKTFTITYNYDQNTTEFNGTPSHADANS